MARHAVWKTWLTMLTFAKRAGEATQSKQLSENWGRISWIQMSFFGGENIKTPQRAVSVQREGCYFISLAGGVKKCELWECWRPSGRTYQHTREKAEERCFMLCSERALLAQRWVFFPRSVCAFTDVYLPEGHRTETQTESVCDDSGMFSVTSTAH